MKILAISKIPPSVTLEKLQPHQVAEAEKVWQLYSNGALREVYFRTDRPGAVLMWECADVEAAKTVLDTLPMVEAGVLDFDIIPLGPFRAYESLFAK